MAATFNTYDDQEKLWNGPAARHGVEAEDMLDRLLKPFEDLLVEAVESKRPQRLLDVGCGTGATTLAAARRLPPGGRAVGIDISEPMVAAARARAEREGLPADFVRADAQTHKFEPASFDLLISRFGVMFFAEPVRAFTNLRRAAADGAEMRFIAWRSAAENAFMTTAERAAAPLLPDLPERKPGAPGQFALADRDRVERILRESGWGGIDISAIDVPCTMPEAELAPYIGRMGPVGLALEKADDATRARIVAVAREAFAPFVQGEEVRFVAACWMIEARSRLG